MSSRCGVISHSFPKTEVTSHPLPFFQSFLMWLDEIGRVGEKRSKWLETCFCASVLLTPSTVHEGIYSTNILDIDDVLSLSTGIAPQGWQWLLSHFSFESQPCFVLPTYLLT
jgi:hypothetical protein